MGSHIQQGWRVLCHLLILHHCSGFLSQWPHRDSFPRSRPWSSSRIVFSSDAVLDEASSPMPTTANGGDEQSSDTLELFERDVTTVFTELRAFTYDPTIPSWFRRRQLSFSTYWGLNEWERHSSRMRLVRFVWDFPKSRLLNRCLPQLTALLVWSIVAVIFSDADSLLRVPLTALSTISTFVAALLTLRTNQGLSRLKTARNAVGNMILYTRNIATMSSTYIMPRDRRLGMKTARLLVCFGWALKSHMRETGGEDLIHCLLQPKEASYVCSQRKKPVAILHLLRQIMANLAMRGLVGSTEHRLIEDSIRQLDGAITECERIRSTPIPPVYAAHTGRLMVIYLVSLPFALLGAGIDSLAAIGLTLTVGYAMLGLDEMSHLFEQPFQFMPLYQLSKVSTMDVADAFCCTPPDLDDDDELAIDETLIPSYWGQSPRLPYDVAERRASWRP